MEILFIATTIYVAYVFYNVVNENKPQTNSLPKVAEKKSPESPPPPVTQVQVESPIAVPPPQVAIEIQSPVDETINEEAVAEVEVESAAQVTTLRNPITGEISKINVSYSFTKRWIKEALVSEGLLDKIYTNNELNADINAKIKQALATLKTLPHYQV